MPSMALGFLGLAFLPFLSLSFMPIDSLRLDFVVDRLLLGDPDLDSRPGVDDREDDRLLSELGEVAGKGSSSASRAPLLLNIVIMNTFTTIRTD